jgi:hypothetical protein
MEPLQELIHRWERYLNQDLVLKKRNDHIKSTIADGKDVFELEVKDRGTFTVKLQDKKFLLRSGKAEQPLISWSVPLWLYKKVLLGEERIAFAMLDEESTVSFDTTNFTHWNGTTALGVILMTREMVKRDSEIKKLAESI